MPLIETRNISKKYADTTVALHDISLVIEKGEFVAVMGPSGSGKSTLLHILGFLDTQTDGEYFFEGSRADDFSEPDLARLRNMRMGFIFQMFNLLPRASVLENVLLPLVYSDMPVNARAGRARKVIAEVGLTNRRGHDVAKLSGGERQRVAIARALVNNPQVIFADEPTGNLDSESGKAIMSILQELNEEKGYTVVLITHETYTAEHAGRLIRLHDGAISEDVFLQQRRRAKDGFIK
jgi:putative ABC transport system ATP-binding protein